VRPRLAALALIQAPRDGASWKPADPALISRQPGSAHVKTCPCDRQNPVFGGRFLSRRFLWSRKNAVLNGGPRVRIHLPPAASHERTVGRAAARCSSAPCASRSVLIIPAEGCSGPNGNLLQSSTCVPNSTTLFGGIWKYSHALTALRVITPYPQNLGMNRLKTVPMLATHAALSACRKKAAAARLGVDQP